jgi:uncharacterized protein (DUF39 family)
MGSLEVWKMAKTFEEINEKIRRGEAVVVTAEEMVEIVRTKGVEKAAKEVDVVTTGTFAPMCSSGAFLNFGHTRPRIKAHRVWINNVPAYAGLAAVDIYIGATEPTVDDPLNKIHPGTFEYGGGHVIEDLVSGKKVKLVAEGYGTDCYPNRRVEMELTLWDFRDAFLFNPRNCYQNYNCAINLSDRIIYTYMGVLKPRGGNVSYCSSGQLSPLLKDPFYRTIGIGTRIFLGGAEGYVVWNGTQHNPDVPRSEKGVPLGPAGTLAVIGDLKQMSPKWLKGASILGYGTSLFVGIGIPIPVLDEEMAYYTGLGDDELFTQIVDLGYDYPQGEVKPLGYVNYKELKSGTIRFQGKEIPTVPLSSYKKAKEIAEILKSWIKEGKFLLGIPQKLLPSTR